MKRISPIVKGTGIEEVGTGASLVKKIAIDIFSKRLNGSHVTFIHANW